MSRHPKLVSNIRKWDEMAGKFHSTFPIESLELNNFIQRDYRVLDYGCGEGRVLRYLREMRIKNVIGCDTSLKMCKIAQKSVCEFDILHLKEHCKYLFGSTFHVIILVAVLSSIIPYSERKEIVRYLHENICKDGLIILGDFGVSNKSLYVERYSKAKIEPFTFKTDEGIYIHHFNIQEMFDLCKGFFNIIKYKTVDAKTIHGRSLPGYVFWGRKILNGKKKL
jgi:SAM-dependent methyltransferase